MKKHHCIGCIGIFNYAGAEVQEGEVCFSISFFFISQFPSLITFNYKFNSTVDWAVEILTSVHHPHYFCREICDSGSCKISWCLICDHPRNFFGGKFWDSGRCKISLCLISDHLQNFVVDSCSISVLLSSANFFVGNFVIVEAANFILVNFVVAAANLCCGHSQIFLLENFVIVKAAKFV